MASIITRAGGKMARLNSIIAVVREWQRGAIAWSAIQFRADLTDDQMATLHRQVYRTISEAALAGVVAEIVGL